MEAILELAFLKFSSIWQLKFNLLSIVMPKSSTLFCFLINGLGHKQKSWVKYTMGGVSYRNFWTSITQVREINRGSPFTEL